MACLEFRELASVVQKMDSTIHQALFVQTLDSATEFPLEAKPPPAPSPTKSQIVPFKGIPILESGKLLLVESGILGFGIQKTAQL